MADMEALFAEMRKAQTGGRDFAAEARAAASASGDSDADSEDTGSEDDASATEHLPPRAMDASRTKACVRVSELGRATAREAKAVARSFAHGDPRDADDPRVPDPALEAARHRAVAGVAAVFESACGKTIGGRWWSHFEAWLYARRSAAASSAAAKARQRREAKGSEGDGVYTAADAPDDATFDPVIPDPALARSDKALERKLEAAGMGRYEIVGVGMELSKACARAHASVAAARSGKRKPVKMSAPFAIKSSGKESEDGPRVSSIEQKSAMKVTLTHGKTRLEVNVETLKKLRALHGRLAFPKSARGDERRFLNDAFCVLARYAAAQGAHHKAGTMQASAPTAVFDVLKKTFGVEAELCASPVNCRFRNFGSAFLDVDRHFGSFGSAFYFKPVTGSFQANPPFDSAFIGRLVNRFETLLRDTNEPLSFVLIVPYWPEEACWKNLTSSPFKRTPLLRLKSNKHGYVAGSSATRVKRTTPASFTTDVVFLQNEAGAFKWPVTAETLRLIKIGFKQGLPNSSAKREAARGDDDDDASMSSSDGGGGSSGTDDDSSGDDETKTTRSFGNDGDEVKAALRLSKGKVWDPDEFLFWGVGSARRWGERPAEWMLDAAGDVLEAHWVGEDPDSEEEDEEGEGEEAEEGDSEEETGEDEDEASESDLELEGEAAGSPDGESDDGEEEEEEESDEDEDDEDEDEEDASGSSGDDDDDDVSSSEEEESDERARKRRR
jgi:hypothetical protein